MTSRRYSETDIVHHMSVVEEEDENTGSLIENQGTPRSKYVPSKKCRISDSPLTTLQQNPLAQTKTDKCNTSIFGNSRISILEEEMQAYAERKCKCDKFENAMKDYKAIQQKIQNYLKLKYPNFSQMDFNGTVSFCGASQISFMEEEMQIMADESCKCDRFQSIIKEYTTLLENFKTNTKSGDRKTDNSGATNELLAELKRELAMAKLEAKEYKAASENAKNEINNLQAALDEEKQRAQDQIDRLQKQFEAMKLGSKNEKCSGNKIEEEFAQLKVELLKTQSEAQEQKNLSEKTQKEIENLQTALANKKKSTNAKICEKNSEMETLIVALKTEMANFKEKAAEAEKLSSQLKTDNELLQNEKNYLQNLINLHETEHAEFKKASEVAVDKVKEELLQLTAQLSDAKKENDLVKKEADKAQAKVKQLQEILDSEKENADIHLQKLQQQTKNENDALKTALNNIELMEEQITALKEKIQDFELQEAENKKAFDKIESENKILQNENAKFGRLCYSKDDEIVPLKESVAKEKRERQKQVFQLSDQLSKVSDELEASKSNLGDSASTQKEIYALKQKLKDFEQKEALFKNKYNQLKSDNQILQNKTIEMEEICTEKDSEIIILKETAEKQKRECQEQILQLNNELTNFKTALNKANSIQKEVDSLKEKLQICGQQESESKKAFEKLKAEMEVIGNEKVDLNYICAAKDVEINRLKEQKQKLENDKTQLLIQISEANEELERFQTTLNIGKEKFMELKGLLKQKDEEIETLMTEIEAHKAVEGKAVSKDDEIEKLKKKASHYKKKNTESEEICNYLRADIEILQEKKTNLENLCAIKDTEVNDLKDTAEKEKAEFKKQLSHLNDQYLKAIIDVEGYKSVAENAQNEIQTLQASIESERKMVDLRIAEMEKEKMEEIEAFKATFGDTISLKQEISELNDKIQNYEQKISENKKMLAKSKNDIAFLQSEKASLKKQISLKETEIAELQENGSPENGRQESEAIRAENRKLKHKLNKIYEDLAEVEVAKKESQGLLVELMSKLDIVDTSKDIVRPTFDIPENLSILLSSNNSSFKSATDELPQSRTLPSNNASEILKEIQKECQELTNSKFSKNISRKTNDSSKKDYNSEESCSTQ